MKIQRCCLVVNSSGIRSGYHEGDSSREGGSGREKKELKEKVAFKTKSEVELLDDGFKWRKYGKKMVKNSPNPRNYYKCLVEGCPVKKRVKRDKEVPRYVVTTYEGIHNHQGPQL
ncbi:putative WRKY transcription factor 50 [Abeliophyllum distichum]|uniref:WRKY transcription factor 50 n=1 Tax=Abeliophyllum distichum TaxID=126358 RepID=A0ABD1TZB6_9LAMI